MKVDSSNICCEISLDESKDISFDNQPKIYTYKECMDLSNYFFYIGNVVQSRFWLEMASDILSGKECKIFQ